MTRERGPYIHGTGAAEQRRLTRLNRLINQSSLARLAPGRGSRVLDVGSGLGQMTRAIARAVGPEGAVVGVESSAEQIAEAERQAGMEGEAGLASFRLGDALDPPLAPEEWGTFDLAHARFVLEHVAEPLAVVRAMARAVRPGGRLVLEDDDHEVLRAWPEPEGLGAAWGAYQRTYVRHGRDPIVGRRLVELLHSAGVRPKRNDWLFFGACAGDPLFDDLVANLIGILVGARSEILASGPIEPAVFDRAIEASRSWGSRPDAALWFARCWAEGTKP